MAFKIPHAFHPIAVLALARSTLAPTPEPDARLTGANNAECAAAWVRCFATVTPRGPSLPKDGMPFLAAQLQLGVGPAGTLQALDRMLDATLKAKGDPFNRTQ